MAAAALPSRNAVPSRRRGTLLALAALAGVPAGCGVEAPAAPPCRSELLPARELLPQPAFASLEYYKRMDYDVVRGYGYDIWGDSRFDYAVALQATLVPREGARGVDDLCAKAIALRVALPADEDKLAKLRVFIRAAAARGALDAPRIEAQVAERLARSEKLRPLAGAGPLSVDAGMVSYSWRGQAFIVSFGSR
jgi:hypothetical protein